jgi:hypothetical protein
MARIEDNSIITCNDCIMKIQMQDEKYYYGYDIFTEKFSVIKKSNPNVAALAPIILKLLHDEKCRYQLVNAICKTEKDIAEVMNTSDRTIFRMKANFGYESLEGSGVKKPLPKEFKIIKK